MLKQGKLVIQQYTCWICHSMFWLLIGLTHKGSADHKQTADVRILFVEMNTPSQWFPFSNSIATCKILNKYAKSVETTRI